MLMKRAHLVQVLLYFRKITEGIGKEKLKVNRQIESLLAKKHKILN